MPSINNHAIDRWYRLINDPVPRGEYSLEIRGEIVVLESPLTNHEAVEAARSLTGEFATDLIHKLNSKGFLSEKQLWWLHKLVADNKPRDLGEQAGHFGDVGRKFVTDVTVESVRSVETQYGTSGFHRMRDNDGRLLVWWCSGTRWLNEGERVTITGRVKGHDEYRGEQQTTVTRITRKEEGET